MTTFVNLSYTTSHPGVTRFERAYASAKNGVQRLQQESTYAAVLLMFGALSLIASIYDIVDASQEGQELGAWVVLWTAILMSLVVFGKYCKRQLVAWFKADREARMWDSALTDHRVMADIRCAQSRSA
ncbi:hypothetical protein [Limnohabitans sp.]|jgi:hypothetical protein|uniref:hypothetical protein n=1 Tax=Limnohabitans sp. TaxID=1907725 RepID=UPI00286EE280|nr:hypothetical protein [Limnohabitans sp.]